MKSILGISLLFFSVSFCNISERLAQFQTATDPSGSALTTSASSDDDGTGDTEIAILTAEQQAIADAANEVTWEQQRMSWKVPAAWKKMDVSKTSLNYGTPATGFLIASVSVMSADFPADISLKATYESALDKLKQGDYETVRWLEIDGVKGVEWVEAAPDESDGIRRQQWIAFRNYQGQNQQLNVMVTTNQANFAKQKDTFAAILYTMRVPKG